MEISKKEIAVERKDLTKEEKAKFGAAAIFLTILEVLLCVVLSLLIIKLFNNLF